MGTELVKFDKKTVEILDKAVEMGLSANAIQSKFERAITLAEAINQLRAALTPAIMRPIMALMNTGLGFRTDRDPSQINSKTGKPHEPYDELTVRDCVIEATLHGLNVVGNEFNIISARMYPTKEGFHHKLADLQKEMKFSYTIIPGVPHVKDSGAIIEMEIRWTLNGKEGKETLPICVRVNSGMGADAIIGKATRKARAWLYAMITGREISDGDVKEDDSKVIEIKAEPVKSAATDLFKESK